MFVEQGLLVIPEFRCKCGYQVQTRDLGFQFGKPMLVAGCTNSNCVEFGKPWLMELMTHQYLTKRSVRLEEAK